MTLKEMQHREISLPERQFIELRLLGKWSQRRIARELGRDHSALSREVRRNTFGGDRYRADLANKHAQARIRKRVRGRKLDRDSELATWVGVRLKLGWSPEKIAGRLKSCPPRYLAGTTVSHESIYQWIYEGDGRFGGLHRYLWTRRKRRFSHKRRKPNKVQIKGRTPLRERSDDGLPGHMETDSMIWYTAKGLLSVQVDRVLKVCRLRWCERRTAHETAHALRRTVETLPHKFIRSMAFDNGSESAQHHILKSEYGIDTFFCAPYSPWQKSQVENINRTIRHWLPRKTKVSDLSDRDWKTIEDRLNNLPRKSLRYLTPNEALTQYLASGATAT